MTNLEKANACYSANFEQIDALLGDIKSGIDARHTDTPDWADAGSMCDYVRSLKDLADKVNQRGEYAA